MRCGWWENLELEDMSMKTSKTGKAKTKKTEKRTEYLRTVKKLQKNYNYKKIHAAENTKRKRQEWREATREAIMTENLPLIVWHKTTNSGSSETTKHDKHPKNYTHVYHIQTRENQRQRKKLKEARVGSRHLICTGTKIRVKSDFSKTIQTIFICCLNNQYGEIFSAEKRKNPTNLEFYNLQNYPSNVKK